VEGIIDKPVNCDGLPAIPTHMSKPYIFMACYVSDILINQRFCNTQDPCQMKTQRFQHVRWLCNAIIRNLRANDVIGDILRQRVSCEVQFISPMSTTIAPPYPLPLFHPCAKLINMR